MRSRTPFTSSLPTKHPSSPDRPSSSMEASRADGADACADRIHRARAYPRDLGGAGRGNRPHCPVAKSSTQRSASARSIWRFWWPNWKRSLASIRLPSSFRSPASGRWTISCEPISRRSFRSSAAAERTTRSAAAVNELDQAGARRSGDDGRHRSPASRSSASPAVFRAPPIRRTFWRNLCDGVESISAAERRGAAVGGSPARAVARSVLREGRPVACPTSTSSTPPSSNTRPQEARLMDPQQRLLLEVAWEALRGRRATRRALGRARSAYSRDWAEW